MAFRVSYSCCFAEEIHPSAQLSRLWGTLENLKRSRKSQSPAVLIWFSVAICFLSTLSTLLFSLSWFATIFRFCTITVFLNIVSHSRIFVEKKAGTRTAARVLLCEWCLCLVASLAFSSSWDNLCHCQSVKCFEASKVSKLWLHVFLLANWPCYPLKWWAALTSFYQSEHWQKETWWHFYSFPMPQYWVKEVMSHEMKVGSVSDLPSWSPSLCQWN